MIGFLIILLIVAYFYERARRRKSKTLMIVLIGVASFIIGGTISNLISDLIFVFEGMPGNDTGEIVMRLILFVGCIVLTFWGLNSLLNPKPKNIPGSTLDGEFIKKTE